MGDILTQIMDSENFRAESLKLDRSTNKHNYWNSQTEKFARAFEAYVGDKLQAEGITDNYLSRKTEGIQFPQGEERVAINAKFEKLFDTIRGNDNQGLDKVAPTSVAKKKERYEIRDELMQKYNISDKEVVAIRDYTNSGYTNTARNKSLDTALEKIPSIE
jgi:hypothetical protein